jgi:hypothetical protein
MYRKLLIAAAIGLAGLSTTAQAGVVLNDTYIGGNDHGFGDSIGGTPFDIVSATASRGAGANSNLMTVDISMHYNGATADDRSNTLLTEFGDLFINPTWNPHGTAADGFRADNYATGTKWGFGVVANGLNASLQNAVNTNTQLGAIGGTITSYALTPSSTILSHVNDPNPACDVPGACWIWRDGQPVQVATAAGTVAGIGEVVTAATAISTVGSWTFTPGATLNDLTYTFDGSGMGVLIGTDDWLMAMSWAMTCGNDVIQGEIGQVPEPASLALFGMSLFGFGFLRRHARRRLQ